MGPRPLLVSAVWTEAALPAAVWDHVVTLRVKPCNEDVRAERREWMAVFHQASMPSFRRSFCEGGNACARSHCVLGLFYTQPSKAKHELR